MKEYDIKNITKDTRKWSQWLLKKHYAKRMPFCVMECFGLYLKKELIGVCTFSVPITKSLNDGTGCFNTLKIQGYELSRLVIIDNHEKNLLSHFVSMCLNEMKKKRAPCFIVSYADANMNHHGYIYQSTNWIYTGTTLNKEKYFNKNGKEIHSRVYHEYLQTHLKMAKEEVVIKQQLGKYRYFYFLGSSRETQRMKKDFKYKILPYPKGENKNYDASYEPKTFSLFE
jgi:hypothetical protein